MDSETSENFIFGALIGGAIGAVAALILAPTSGESLRRKIGNSLNLSSPREKAHRAHSSHHNQHSNSQDRQAHARRSSGPKKMKDHHSKYDENFSASPRASSRSRSSSHAKSSTHRTYK